uniref:Uncharacterized protein n=1 Tax=Plectus sambesii TaxID=2011161 RepID=A0A914UQ79_9BILA
MPTAHANRRLHSSLLDCAVSSSATSFSRLKWAIRVLPPHLRLAIYEKMHDQGRLCQLGYEWCDLEVFEVVLSVKHRRYQVHQIFQALMDHGLRLNEVLTSCLHTKCSQFLAEKRWTVKEVTNLLNLSIDLGRFLLDASWYVASQRCFQLSLTIIDETPNVSSDWRDWQRIQVYHWLMDVYNSNCVYKDALVLYERSWALVKKYSEQKRPPLNLADVFIQYALMFFNVGDYDQAVGWAVDALKQIDGGRTSIRTVIEVCRHASKMLLTRRQFKQAELLVQHAV